MGTARLWYGEERVHKLIRELSVTHSDSLCNSVTQRDFSLCHSLNGENSVLLLARARLFFAGTTDLFGRWQFWELGGVRKEKEGNGNGHIGVKK